MGGDVACTLEEKVSFDWIRVSLSGDKEDGIVVLTGGLEGGMRLLGFGIFLGAFAPFLDFVVGEFFSIAVGIADGIELRCGVIFRNFALVEFVVIEFLSDDGAVGIRNECHGSRNSPGGGRFRSWLEKDLGADRRGILLIASEDALEEFDGVGQFGARLKVQDC